MTELHEIGGAVAVDSAGTAFDNPEAYIPRDRRRALASGVELPDRISGAGLFADISGFTALTEALASELGAQRGAEELTANLNRVFHAIIAELDGFGGDVIYFSGDAITCWLDGDDGSRAVACALAMQKTIAREGHVSTPGGTSVQLGMKVAVVWDRRGGSSSAIRTSSSSTSSPASSSTSSRVSSSSPRRARWCSGPPRSSRSAIAPGSSSFGRTRKAGMPGWSRRLPRSTAVSGAEPEPLPEELVRPWCLPAVYERLRTGRGEFLAELRSAIPVFVRFTGIDYDSDDDATEKLDDFVHRSQRVFAEHGGTCSSSRWATRAPTCTRSSALRSHMRTTRPGRPRPQSRSSSSRESVRLETSRSGSRTAECAAERTGM